MTTNNKGADALLQFFAAAKTLDSASLSYDSAAEAAVKADVPLLLSSGEISQKEIAAAAGLTETAAQYHAAVLEAMVYEPDMRASELRPLFVAVHKTKGLSLSAIRGEVRNLPETSKRSDVARLLRNAIGAATAPSKAAPAKKTPEAMEDRCKRCTAAISTIKDTSKVTLVSAAALLAEAQRVYAAVKAREVAAATVTVTEEVTATTV